MQTAYDTATEAILAMGYDLTPRIHTSFSNKTYGRGETIEKQDGDKVTLCYFDYVSEKFIVDQYTK